MTEQTGTTIKMMVGIRSGLLTGDDIDFTARFYTTPSHSVVLTKQQLIRQSPTEFLAVVPTDNMRSGRIMLEVNALIPDEDCTEGVRPERETIFTGKILKKGIAWDASR